MLSFIKCFERVLIKIISDLFPDTLNKNLQHFFQPKLNSETTVFVPFGKTLIGLVEMEQKNFFAKN